MFTLTTLAIIAALGLLGLVTVRITRSVSGYIGGNQTLTVTANTGETINPTIPAAQPATLSVHTDATHGTLTMTNTSHGIITGQRLDLQWAGGQAYNVTAGTVAGTTVPITVNGSGSTALPAATTAITVGIPQQAVINVVGNNIQAIVCVGPNAGYVVFESTVPADLLSVFLNAGSVYTWTTSDGTANPLAGATVATAWVSHFNTTSQQVNQVTAVLFN